MAEEYDYVRAENKPPLFNIPGLEIQQSMFIGCGGLGSNVINSLKHRISDYFGDMLPEEALKFLSVDSASSQERDKDEAPWILDKNNEVFRLSLSEWKSLKDNHPSVKTWFPKYIPEKIEREVDERGIGCATTRVFGRLSLHQSGIARGLYNHIKSFSQRNVRASYRSDRLNKNVKVKSDAINFFIVSTLGGGTGTGIFMDVAALIRKVQKDHVGNKNFFIFGIFILPTRLSQLNPSGSPEKVNANSYAAIKELQYYLDGNPFRAQYDKSGKLRVYCDNKNSDNKLFNLPFIIEGINEKKFALKNRIELGNFISGMLFLLSTTEVGLLFQLRGIDIRAGDGATTGYDPVGRPDVVIDPQRTVFCDFGWATLHIPLNSMLEIARIMTVIDIIERLASSEKPVKPEKTTIGFSKTIDKFFLTPSKGVESKKFIDRTGISKVIHAEVLKGFSEESSKTGRKIIEKTETIRALKFNDDFLTQILSSYRTKDKFKLMMQKSRADIETEAIDLTANDMGGNIEEAIESFLNEYLSWVKKDDLGPVMKSEFSKAVQAALISEPVKKHGIRFVLEGLKKLREVCLDIKNAANSRIDELNPLIENLKIKRDKQLKDLRDINDELLTMIPFLGKKRLETYLQNFLDSDFKCKIYKFERKRCQIAVEKILPAYDDQIKRWYDRLLNMDDKADKTRHVLFAREEKIKRELGAFGSNDFLTPFNANQRKKFFHIYSDSVNLSDIIEDIQNNGVLYRKSTKSMPENLKFSELLQYLGPVEIADILVDYIKNIEKEKQEISARLLELNFDENTGRSMREEYLFADGPNGDIEIMHSNLVRYGCPMTCADGSRKSLHYAYSESKVWQELLKEQEGNVIDFLNGNFDHKVTCANFRIGIAPHQLTNIEDWYEDYKDLERKGEPLHIFDGAYLWPEPHTDYFFNKEPETLFNFAVKRDYGPLIVKTDQGDWKLKKPPIIDRFQGDYCRFHIIDNKDDIIAELQCNDQIYTEISRRIVRKLLETDQDQKAEKLAKEGIISINDYKLTREDVYGKRFFPFESKFIATKRSNDLFEEALKLGIIEEITTENDPAYSLFTIARPNNFSTDCSVHDTRENLINELQVNEAMYERFCDQIVVHVYNSNEEAARRRLYSELIQSSVLPPYLESVLKEQYAID